MGKCPYMVEGLKILLSDGDKIFLELCKTHLRKSGVTILTCQNGKDALDIIRNERPHLADGSRNEHNEWRIVARQLKWMNHCRLYPSCLPCRPEGRKKLKDAIKPDAMTFF
jgi:CheY-like chemotaxis protein